MSLQREGRFRATVHDLAVGEIGENKLLAVQARYSLYEERNGNEWTDVASERMEGLYSVFVFKRDGSFNDAGIRQLESAFGINAKALENIFQLQDRQDLPYVQATVKWQNRNGQQELQISWIDNVEATGPMLQPASAQDQRALLAKYGPKFRAQFGVSRQSAPPPPSAARPAVSQQTQAPPSPMPAPPTNETECWNRFIAVAAQMDTGVREQRWADALATVFDQRDPNSGSPSDWAKVLDLLQDAF